MLLIPLTVKHINNMFIVNTYLFRPNKNGVKLKKLLKMSGKLHGPFTNFKIYGVEKDLFRDLLMVKKP